MDKAVHALALFEAIRSVFFDHRNTLSQERIKNLLALTTPERTIEAFYDTLRIASYADAAPQKLDISLDGFLDRVTVRFPVKTSLLFKILRGITPFIDHESDYIEIWVSQGRGWRMGYGYSIGIHHEAIEMLKAIRTQIKLFNGQLVHINEEKDSAFYILRQSQAQKIFIDARDEDSFRFIMDQFMQ